MRNSQLETYKRIEKDLVMIKNGLVKEIENRKNAEQANQLLEQELQEMKKVKIK